MPVFAELKNNVVEQVIFADKREYAQAFFPGSVLIQETSSTNAAVVGSVYDVSRGIFIPPVELAK